MNNEFGSFFEYSSSPFSMTDQTCIKGVGLVGTGRQALRFILSSVGAKRVKTLLIPSYFCHDVTKYISNIVKTKLYDCRPFDDDRIIEIQSDEIVISNEYFGQRSNVVVVGDGSVILDRTQHPFVGHEYDRQPDYIYASLRKSLAVPDGAYVWPCDAQPAPLRAHQEVAESMLQAMLLKSLYLKGLLQTKEQYLDLYRSSEANFDNIDQVSAPSTFCSSVYNRINRSFLADSKNENAARLKDGLQNMRNGVEFLPTPSHGLLLFPDREGRDRARRDLLSHDMYTAIFWDGCNKSNADRKFSERHLAIHIDYRQNGRIDEIIDRLLKI